MKPNFLDIPYSNDGATILICLIINIHGFYRKHIHAW